MQYKLKKATFVGGELANFDAPENKNAKTGHANAKVYAIGPQYELETPVKHKNNNSTNLSTTRYIVIRVNTYVKNVFLSVPKNFKNLSKIFTNNSPLSKLT